MFTNHPTLDAILSGLILIAMGMLWVVVLVRVNGLRSFSKMTNFDFVMTVAVGSLLAGTGQSRDWNGFLQGIAAMVGLFLVQFVSAKIRKSSDKAQSIMQNEPTVLMRDGVILDEALKKTRVARSDLIAKLREANVLRFEDVRAVILETTGDISVLHGDACNDALLEGTKRVD